MTRRRAALALARLAETCNHVSGARSARVSRLCIDLWQYGISAECPMMPTPSWRDIQRENARIRRLRARVYR